MKKYYKIMLVIISMIILIVGCGVNKDNNEDKYVERINNINEKCDEIYGKIIKIYELNLSGELVNKKEKPSKYGTLPIRKEDIARGLNIERDDFYKKTRGLHTMKEDLLFIYTPNTVDSLTRRVMKRAVIFYFKEDGTFTELISEIKDVSEGLLDIVEKSSKKEKKDFKNLVDIQKNIIKKCELLYENENGGDENFINLYEELDKEIKEIKKNIK